MWWIRTWRLTAAREQRRTEQGNHELASTMYFSSSTKCGGERRYFEGFALGGGKCWVVAWSECGRTAGGIPDGELEQLVGTMGMTRRVRLRNVRMRRSKAKKRMGKFGGILIVLRLSNKVDLLPCFCPIERWMSRQLLPWGALLL